MAEIVLTLALLLGYVVFKTAVVAVSARRQVTGRQLSAATLFGYAGGFLAVSMGLAAVGIGLERIALDASALSVRIGLGLQAVVQNFVAGLILLAE